MQIGDNVKVSFEEVPHGEFGSDTLRLIVWEWLEDERITSGGEWAIKDIFESDSKEWLEDRLLELTTPWQGRKGRKLRRRMA